MKTTKYFSVVAERIATATVTDTMERIRNMIATALDSMTAERIPGYIVKAYAHALEMASGDDTENARAEIYADMECVNLFVLGMI